MTKRPKILLLGIMKEDYSKSAEVFEKSSKSIRHTKKFLALKKENITFSGIYRRKN